MAWYKILARVAKFFGQYELIMDRSGTEPYLHRYYLLSSRIFEHPLLNRGWFARMRLYRLSHRLVLHCFARGDEDGLHDHPWYWGTRLLEGVYIEQVPGGAILRAPETGWRWAKPEDLHKIVLPERMRGKVWTLFLMGPHIHEWGFIAKNGKWIEHREYFRNRAAYFDIDNP